MDTRNLALISCSPDFSELALAEMRAVADQAQPAAEWAPGVFLVSLLEPFAETAELLRKSPAVFVRHICPCDILLENSDTRDDVSALCDALRREVLPRLDTSLSFSIQTRVFGEHALRPYVVNTALAECVAEGGNAALDVRNPEQVISVAVHGTSIVLGLSLVADNLSSWAGGARRFAREPEQVSRAEFKLLEALDIFGVDLPGEGRALDLGAAPGGWTRVLRSRGLQVTAVDPAHLADTVANDPGVKHVQDKAESLLRRTPGQFQLLVNDMRQDARDSARLMVSLAPLLAEGGEGIMTLKLPHKGAKRVMQTALNILGQGYHVAGARQLFHNRSEVTVHLTGSRSS